MHLFSFNRFSKGDFSVFGINLYEPTIPDEILLLTMRTGCIEEKMIRDTIRAIARQFIDHHQHLLAVPLHREVCEPPLTFQ